MSTFFVLIQYLLPHHLLSRLVGKLAQAKIGKNLLIKTFIKRYKVDLSESQIENIDRFSSFNDFFTRELKPETRPIDSNPNTIVSPADGSLSQIGSISDGKLLQAKGHLYSLTGLLGGDTNISAQFDGGKFATVYLSPRDYHRVHMPLAGKLEKMIYIPGRLFSVNQVTAARVPNLFARNERAVCLFETDVGPMAVIMVGAMIVAGIETVWSGRVCPARDSRQIRVSEYAQHSPPIELSTGSELGRFRLGSTAIILFGHGVAEWETTLMENSVLRMGEKIGVCKTKRQ